MGGGERKLSELQALAERGFLRVGTTAVIVDQYGRYLLVRETTSDPFTGKIGGCWSLPSDKAKVGENFLMTLVRGLNDELPGIVEHLFLAKNCLLGEIGARTVCSRLVLLSYAGPADLQFTSEEVAEARWFKPEEICSSNDSFIFRPGMTGLFGVMGRLLPPKGIRPGKELLAVFQKLKAVSPEAPDVDLVELP
jgi:ADP-ribose pyrophosphatase YjhB (NUDIX family)